MPKLLKFVPKSNPILRTVMPEITDFSDPGLTAIISDMCYSILPEQLRKVDSAHSGAAGMAANQWGINRRVFIFTPDGSEAGEKREVMINPSYVPYLRPGEMKPKMTASYEGCFSIPLTTAAVTRFDAITAKYDLPDGTHVEKVMEGWEARVFQHETDHLDGKLFDGTLDGFAGPVCEDRIIFKDHAEMEDFWVNSVRPSRKK